MARPSHRSFLAALAACVATHAATAVAQQVRIEQRLPGIMPRWTEQSDRKVRYAGYSLWVNAFDAAVRQANRAMCGADVVRSSPLSRVDGAQVVWRTGTAKAYDWLVAAPYYAGDVVWVDPRASGGLSVGDIIVQYRTRAGPPPFKVKLGSGVRLPGSTTGDAPFDAIVARQNATAGMQLLYRADTFSLLSAGERTSRESEPLVCSGKSTVSFGGMGVSLSSMIAGVTSVGKNLIDDDPNRYARGGSPEFRRFTADVFTPDQLKWMIVDQFAVDLTARFFDKPQEVAFDEAVRRALAKTAARMGVPAELDAFGPAWRARAVYLGVFAGHNMDLGEAGYVDFLDARDRVLHGGPDASKARMRADLVHQWFAELPRRTGRDGTAVPAIAASIALM